jgi:hypothetical protein
MIIKVVTKTITSSKYIRQDCHCNPLSTISIRRSEKCQLLRKEVTFLGHVVSEKGVQPNPDNIAKILAWPTPKTVTEVRQVLGMGSYYRRFIKDFSILVPRLIQPI